MTVDTPNNPNNFNDDNNLRDPNNDQFNTNIIVQVYDVDFTFHPKFDFPDAEKLTKNQLKEVMHGHNIVIKGFTSATNIAYPYINEDYSLSLCFEQLFDFTVKNDQAVLVNIGNSILSEMVNRKLEMQMAMGSFSFRFPTENCAFQVTGKAIPKPELSLEAAFEATKRKLAESQKFEIPDMLTDAVDKHLDNVLAPMLKELNRYDVFTDMREYLLNMMKYIYTEGVNKGLTYDDGFNY